MGLKGIYLALHTFRGSQVQWNALCHPVFKGGRLAECGFRNMHSKEVRNNHSVFRCMRHRGIPSEERDKRGTVTDFSYIVGHSREGQSWPANEWWQQAWEKENSNLILGKLLAREAMGFPSLRDAPNSTRKGRIQDGQNSELDLTSKSAMVWAGVWAKCHQRCFLTSIIA